MSAFAGDLHPNHQMLCEFIDALELSVQMFLADPAQEIPPRAVEACLVILSAVPETLLASVLRCSPARKDHRSQRSSGTEFAVEASQREHPCRFYARGNP